MNLAIQKKIIKSLLREVEFFEVIVNIEMGEDEALFSKYFDEDFNFSLHVDGARERGHTLSTSRPATKVKFNLRHREPIDLLFAHESDANIFIERLKEQVKNLMKLLREKSSESHPFDEDIQIEI